MVIASILSPKYQVKPITLPCRLQPTTLQIKQELDATKTVTAASKPAAETICNGLSKLAELYKCMGDVLNMPCMQVLISGDQNKRLVEELIDQSLNFLDVCGSIRDMVTQYKEHIIDLQCALRRKECENGIMKYKCFRKKIKKDAKVLLARLKQVDNMEIDSDNLQLAAVMQAVKGVSETVSVFESLLLYISTPISKPNRWSSVVSKFIHKGKVAHEIRNEFIKIDYGLQTLIKNGSSIQGDKMQIVKCSLERQETLIDCIETRLECIFRGLIRTRASLLNIISL